MARHRRRLRRRTSEQRIDAAEPHLANHAVGEPDQPAEGGPLADAPIADEPLANAPLANESSPDEDWFAPSDEEEARYAAGMDVSLASMLMLGTTAYQRVDGMGLARKALEAPPTGDPRRDLSADERFLLANARAWCLLVHGDLGHRGRLDDPFVLADAERYLTIARGTVPDSPHAGTTLALLQLRQGTAEEALQTARRTVESFAQLPDHQRTGNTGGAALLAVVTLALASASCGEAAVAQALSLAARAARTSLEIDEAAFAALMTQLDVALDGGA